MNERIKQLVDEATIKTSHKYHTWGDRIATETKEVFDKEKFAELIVRECLGCSNNLANHYIDNHSEKEQTLLLASIADYSNEIRKHFGVEVTELDEPETPFWRPVMTNTVADLRSVVNNAMNRGEHNIAIALIELIKKNS